MNKYVDKHVTRFRDELGRLHREDGPAVVWNYGKREWWLNGERHREDGPAVEWSDVKLKRWYRHGKLHRKDGPADVDTYGYRWYFNGKLHREDGPAVEWARGLYGAKEWWFHGELHREGGPARETRSDGRKRWYRHGKLHREDGPAVEDMTGKKEYWLNGLLVSEVEFMARSRGNSRRSGSAPLLLGLADRPAAPEWLLPRFSAR